MNAKTRVIIGLILCITLALLPTGIAFMRQHNSLVLIGLVNVLLGVTGIGWIVALIWAFSDNAEEKRPVPELIKGLTNGSL